jgi:hypothetical protein
MGIRVHRDVVGESFSGTAGATTVYRPFPDLAGKLRAGYNFGSAYAAYAPEALGRHLGSRYDWSGKEQHIGRFGRWTPDAYWLVCQVSSIMPRTPFAANALISDPDQGVTIVAFTYSDATAKAISLARSLGAADGSNSDLSTTADAYITLGLQPPTSSGRVVAGASVLNNFVQATLSPLPDELGEVSMYAGTYTSSARQAFAIGPGSVLKSGIVESTSRLLASTGHFIMGAETGAGAGLNRLLAVAYYRPVLTSDELLEIHSRYATFHSAIASGLTIL